MPTRNIISKLVIAASVAVIVSGCGGGGGVTPMTDSGGAPMTGGGTPPTGSTTDPQARNAQYTYSVNGGRFVTKAVRVTEGAVEVGGQTVRLELATQVGDQSGRYRVFDTPGATSGAALEIHSLGENDGYDHLQFGSWAKGIVSPNPGFRIGTEFGGYLAPQAGSNPTPVNELPVVGSATYDGHYSGYVHREGSAVSQVDGRAVMIATWYNTPDSSSILVELTPPAGDPGGDRVIMLAPITGNGFGGDVTDTRTIPGTGITVRGRTSIQVINQGGQSPYLGGDVRYGDANSGGFRGGFFGNRGGEAGGTYGFAVGRTVAVGAFGGTLQ